MIPYGRQSISDDDVAAVVEVLRSDYLTQGPVVPRFEARVSAAAGAAHAVAMNSATSALHVACMALGVGPGSLVWTSPISFVASSNCALYCGASVDFVDIDPGTCNMSVDLLAQKLHGAERDGALPDVVVPVHLAGQSCDMAAIGALAQRYGFKVIEDASHAIGAVYRGRPVGNCRYSDVTIFSFHPVKIVTTAEGGVAVTGDAALAARMALLRSHGITREPGEMRGSPDGPWYYEQIALGYNYRLTEMCAALGISQMDRLTEFVAERRRLAARYDVLLADLPLTLPVRSADANSAWHLYVVRPDLSRVERSHAAIFEALRAVGIGVNLHYMPIYLQPYYRDLGFMPGHCPNAEAYYARAISIPIFATLGDEGQDVVVAALREALG